MEEENPYSMLFFLSETKTEAMSERMQEIVTPKVSKSSEQMELFYTIGCPHSY